MQAARMRQFAGCRRRVWNLALERQQQRRAAGESYAGFSAMCKWVTAWRNDPELSYLKEAPVHALQDAVRSLDAAFQRFFRNLREVPEVVVSDGIEPMGIAEGPYAGKPNPHAWMSPTAALVYVDNIRDAFVKYDPANAETYKANAEAYKARITAAIEPITITYAWTGTTMSAASRGRSQRKIARNRPNSSSAAPSSPSHDSGRVRNATANAT